MVNAQAAHSRIDLNDNEILIFEPISDGFHPIKWLHDQKVFISEINSLTLLGNQSEDLCTVKRAIFQMD